MASRRSRPSSARVVILSEMKHLTQAEPACSLACVLYSAFGRSLASLGMTLVRDGNKLKLRSVAKLCSHRVCAYHIAISASSSPDCATKDRMEDKPIAAIRQRFAVRRMRSGKNSLSHSRRTRFASSVKFRLTSHCPSVFLLAITENQLQFTSDMKKIFIVSMLIAFAMICACQKQNSAAEQQLAQRKTELDTREAALDEREKALVERENRIQQLPPEFRTLLVSPPDPARVKAERAEKDRMARERLSQRPLKPEDLQRQWQRNLDKAKMSGNAVFPAAEATSPTPSPAVEATSPSPSPTPE